MKIKYFGRENSLFLNFVKGDLIFPGFQDSFNCGQTHFQLSDFPMRFTRSFKKIKGLPVEFLRLFKSVFFNSCPSYRGTDKGFYPARK